SMNYYYASRCLPSMAQEGSYADVLEKRLLAAETAVHRNSLLVDTLVRELDKRLSAEEKGVITRLMQQSQEQAAVLSVELAKLPAPPLPDLTWTADFEDPSKMGQVLDDAFENALYDDMKVHTSSARKRPRDNNGQLLDDDLAGEWGERYLDDDAAAAAGAGDGSDAETQCLDWSNK